MLRQGMAALTGGQGEAVAFPLLGSPSLSLGIKRSRRAMAHLEGGTGTARLRAGSCCASAATGAGGRGTGAVAGVGVASGERVPIPEAAQGKRAPRAENVEGDWYVDHTCIDCDTCRWMAPTVFSRHGGMSAVHHQPASSAERMDALQALLACPTASIHTHSRPSDISAAHASFPLAVSPDLPGVYHCGYHSPKSFGAASYFVRLPGLGVLVDSPRYTPALAQRLEELGGVDCIFLTHRDDVADHAKWAAHFSCPRVLHSLEVSASTRDVEIVLTGTGPWALQDILPPKAGSTEKRQSRQEEKGNPALPLGAELTVLFTPGHTEGHCCLHLRQPGPGGGGVGALFSGDHLALDQTNRFLSVHPRFNWCSVEMQIQSACDLKDLPFLWVLPGHGRRCRFNDEEEKRRMLAGFCGEGRQPLVEMTEPLKSSQKGFPCYARLPVALGVGLSSLGPKGCL